MPRPRHPQELEARFRRPVEASVAHRLPIHTQACLEEALAATRASHLAIHEASRILAEALEGQMDLSRAARVELRATMAAAEQALQVLE